MLRYPELLAWEMLWTDSLRETYAAIYKQVKEVKPSLGVGWHIWHTNSFNPIYRAEQDLAAIAPVSDFLKIVIYHNCGGERMAEYIESVHQTLYGDVPQQELLDFHYRVLDYQEKSLAEIPFTGLSADYVYRETKRARAGLAGTKTQLWPGIDIDIPTAAESQQVHTGRDQGRSAGGVSRRRRWRDSVAKVFGDEARQSKGRAFGAAATCLDLDGGWSTRCVTLSWVRRALPYIPEPTLRRSRL